MDLCRARAGYMPGSGSGYGSGYMPGYGSGYGSGHAGLRLGLRLGLLLPDPYHSPGPYDHHLMHGRARRSSWTATGR